MRRICHFAEAKWHGTTTLWRRLAFATGFAILLKRMANAFPVGECGGYAISLQRNGKWYYDTFYLYTFYCDGIQTK
jgi:hypothetical protein